MTAKRRTRFIATMTFNETATFENSWLCNSEKEAYDHFKAKAARLGARLITVRTSRAKRNNMR